MLQSAEPHPPVHDRDPEGAAWPLLIALAVIGPFALAAGIALLVFIAS